MTRALITLLLLSFLLSCATPRVQLSTNITQSPRLTPDRLIMDDGYELPLSIWRPGIEPQAIVLALHGFNDYRNAFTRVAAELTTKGIQVYAYDQRGFGETAERGIWPGSERLYRDASLSSELLCARHPGIPVYLLGESMGGAVALLMLEQNRQSCVDGVVLAAPAVWGWRSMPLWQQSALWLAAHVWPAKKLTGEGLEIQASDNIEMLRAQWRDPLIIKETRIDTMYGLTTLMESALLSSAHLNRPALILYGEKDEIIPAKPVCRMLTALPEKQPGNWRLALYPEGYHMLTRDLQAKTVLNDIVAWLQNSYTGLPSGLEVAKETPRLQSICGTIH